jgi:hypothetical protein
MIQEIEGIYRARLPSRRLVSHEETRLRFGGISCATTGGAGVEKLGLFVMSEGTIAPGVRFRNGEKPPWKTAFIEAARVGVNPLDRFCADFRGREGEVSAMIA